MSFLKKKGFVFCAGIGVLFALGLCMMLMLLAAFLMYKEAIPQSTGAIMTCFCGGVGVFAASVMISKLRGRQALPMGAVLASAFIMVAMLVRLWAGGGTAMGPWLMWLSVAVFCGGLLGAVIAAGKSTRVRRHHGRKR